MSWAAESSPRWNELKPFAIVTVATLAAMETISKWFGLHRFAAMGIVVSGGALVFNAFWPLLVITWFAAAAYLLGRSALECAKVDIEETGAIAPFLVGAAIYATIVGLLAHWPVNYPGLYAVGLALPLVFRRRLLMELLSSVSASSLQRTGQGGWLDAFISAIAVLHLVVALMPEVGHDALATHLFVPGHLAMRHSWAFDVTLYSWAVMPMLGDWIFSIGYMLSGEQGARLINALFILANAWLVRDLACWVGASERSSRVGVLLFLTTPLVLLESSSLYIESVWAAFIVGGSLALFKFSWGKHDHLTLAFPAGILLGAGVAAKAISLSILPSLFIVLLIGVRNWLKPGVAKPLILGLLAFSMVGGVPYLTAWVITANPLFPYFNQIFKSQLWPLSNFEDSRWSKGLKWDSIFQLTFNSSKFLEGRPGSSGFQWVFLLLPSFILFLRGRDFRALALIFVGISSVAITFNSIAYLRYIFPAIIFLTAAIAAGISMVSLEGGGMRWILAGAAFVAVTMNLLFFKSATYYGQIALQPLLDTSARSSYLAVNLPIRNAVEFINKVNVRRAPVAFFSSPLAGGLSSDALYASWYNPAFEAQVNSSDTDEAFGEVLARNRVDYVVIDPNWANENLQRRVENVTDPVWQVMDISVRKLKNEFFYKKEMLKNPDFLSRDGWVFSTPGQTVVDGAIIVSVSSPATQKVAIVAGRDYRASVTAQCPDGSSNGRVQVNWLDRKDRLISSSIRVFECNPQLVTHEMDMVAPKKAVIANVYATGHMEQPIRVTKVSFKE